MKILSKLLCVTLAVTVLFFTTKARAQTTPAHALRFNIGPEIGDPTGNARLGSNFSLGATGRFQYGITDRFAVTFTSGGYHFFPILIPGTTRRYNSYGVIPIKAGIKEFFMPHLYFGMEAGVGLEISERTTLGQKKLDLSPAIGWGNKHWDFGVHYDSLTGDNNNYGLLALHVAYGITSK